MPETEKKMVHTYLKPKEKKKIEEKAEEIGVSVSTYLKLKGLDKL